MVESLASKCIIFGEMWGLKIARKSGHLYKISFESKVTLQKMNSCTDIFPGF